MVMSNQLELMYDFLYSDAEIDLSDKEKVLPDKDRSALIDDACQAEEEFGLDELELYAAMMKLQQK